MDEIHEVTGMKLAELRDVMTERKQWRRLVKTVARAQKVDSTRWQRIIERSHESLRVGSWVSMNSKTASKWNWKETFQIWVIDGNKYQLFCESLFLPFKKLNNDLVRNNYFSSVFFCKMMYCLLLSDALSFIKCYIVFY